MKLLVKEYLASLRERGELDALLPDLLSEMGWDVYSRPAVGVRQMGVDMAACGPDDDGVRKVFLFSLKAGNLTRADWDGSVQALRPSINEILDTYIGQRIPKRYADLPVVICLCFGGDVEQAVEGQVRGFTANATTDRVSFQEWNGDKIANLLLTGALREQLLPQSSRSSFRKSVAMLDEADASFSYFSTLLDQLIDAAKATPKDRLSVARRINICLWILYVWSREANNVESPYRSSELAMLRVWKLVEPHLDKKGAIAASLRRAADSLIELHLQIATHYASEKIFPLCAVPHGLSSAVRSRSSVDVNLRLFDVLGRVSLLGMWLTFIRQRRAEMGHAEEVDRLGDLIGRSRQAATSMIINNPTLCTPIKDEHAIEVNLACLFLVAHGEADFVRHWILQITNASIFGYRSRRQYPTTFNDYRRLIQHPKSGDEYREEATAASFLYPTLAGWGKILHQPQVLKALAEFSSDDLQHCSMQLWFPAQDTEEQIYANSAEHGVTATSLKLTEDGLTFERIIARESRENSAFSSLSVIRWGVWPLLLVACRHHRLPVPPNFWMGIGGFGGSVAGEPGQPMPAASAQEA